MKSTIKPISDIWYRNVSKIIPEENIPANIIVSDLTFCGAFEKFYPAISQRWNSIQTKKDYNRIMENHILPALHNHNNKLIFEYTFDDFEKMTDIIRNKNSEPYSESYISKIEQIVYYTIYFTAQYHYCEDVLWGTRFSVSNIQPEEKYNRLYRIKKYLSVEQEQSMISILEDENIPGEIVGNLLMYVLGTRDAEASGLNYGDLQDMLEYADQKNFWVYKSTEANSNELQTSGKTNNMNRIIPGAELLITFLKKRYQRICAFARLDNINPSEVPIANRGLLSRETYNKRCSTIDISSAGSRLLKSIGVTSEQLAYLDTELYGIDKDCAVRESAPTAYLNRRNFSNHMKILGLDLSQRQYAIGHDIESGKKRSEFVNEKNLHDIGVLLSKRPLLNNYDHKRFIHDSGHISFPTEYGKTIYHIPINGKKVVIRVKAKEPLDTLSVRIINNDANIPATYTEEEYIPTIYPEYVDVRKQYEKRYNS